MRDPRRREPEVADIGPGVPISTLLFDGEVFGERLAGHPVRTSRLQRLGARQSPYKALLPVMTAAAERLPISGHDLVISSSSAFTHGVQPDSDTVHVCHCYTPFRYAWYEQEAGVMQAPRPARPLLRRSLEAIQRWDHRQAQRGTRYVARSRLSQQRIREYWAWRPTSSTRP